jgi:hypothetical protein
MSPVALKAFAVPTSLVFEDFCGDDTGPASPSPLAGNLPLLLGSEKNDGHALTASPRPAGRKLTPWRDSSDGEANSDEESIARPRRLPARLKRKPTPCCELNDDGTDDEPVTLARKLTPWAADVFA